MKQCIGVASEFFACEFTPTLNTLRTYVQIANTADVITRSHAVWIPLHLLHPPHLPAAGLVTCTAAHKPLTKASLPAVVMLPHWKLLSALASDLPPEIFAVLWKVHKIKHFHKPSFCSYGFCIASQSHKSSANVFLIRSFIKELALCTCASHSV